MFMICSVPRATISTLPIKDHVTGQVLILDGRLLMPGKEDHVRGAPVATISASRGWVDVGPWRAWSSFLVATSTLTMALWVLVETYIWN